MSTKTKSVAAEKNGVETFHVKLPTHQARRVRYLALERKITPEAYIAEGAVSQTFFDFDNSVVTDQLWETGTAIAANTSGKTKRRETLTIPR